MPEKACKMYECMPALPLFYEFAYTCTQAGIPFATDPYLYLSNLNPMSSTTYRGFLLIMLALMAASTTWAQKKQAKGKAAPTGGKPDWVTQRPKVPGYYIGIGSARLAGTPNEYQETARQVALTDMSQEIVVQIVSDAKLTDTQDNNVINTKFQQDIRTITENSLEGYEPVDSYNDGTNYWVYYRLNKTVYYTNKKKKFDAAMAASESSFTRAEELLNSGDVYTAYLFYTQSLNPLLPYLIAAIESEFKQASQTQAQKATERLITITSGLRFEAITKEPTYKFGARQDLPLELRVVYKSTRGDMPVAKFPVLFKFTSGGGNFLNPYANANPEGVVRAIINKIDPTKGGALVVAEFDTREFTALNDPKISQFNIGQVAPPKANFRIKTVGPAVKVMSDEKSLGKPLPVNILETTVKEFLTQNGCEVNPTNRPPDFVIKIQAETRQGTSVGTAFQSLMNAKITAVANDGTETEVVNLLIQDLVGRKFDFENASNDAYAKARKRLTDEFLPAFINKLYN